MFTIEICPQEDNPLNFGDCYLRPNWGHIFKKVWLSCNRQSRSDFNITSYQKNCYLVEPYDNIPKKRAWNRIINYNYYCEMFDLKLIANSQSCITFPALILIDHLISIVYSKLFKKGSLFFIFLMINVFLHGIIENSKPEIFISE